MCGFPVVYSPVKKKSPWTQWSLTSKVSSPAVSWHFLSLSGGGSKRVLGSADGAGGKLTTSVSMSRHSRRHHSWNYYATLGMTGPTAARHAQQIVLWYICSLAHTLSATLSCWEAECISPVALLQRYQRYCQTFPWDFPMWALQSQIEWESSCYSTRHEKEPEPITSLWSRSCR